MDITPAPSPDQMRVEAYGNGGFRITGTRHEGSVLVFPDRVAPWAVASPTEITADDFAAVIECAPPVEVLLIGTGTTVRRLRAVDRAALEKCFGVDVMTTGAACRTYNVLLAEDRRVAAALIAVD